MKIETVGVVGAGVMGVGVAQDFAQNGFKVLLMDHSRKALESVRGRIIDGCRFQQFFRKADKELLGLDEVLERIELTESMEALREVDYVVENVTEDWNIKKPIYERLDKICRDGVVFAANTSCISITKFGSATGRPDRVVGTHYMNPVPLKKTVEVIRGFHTSDWAIETTVALLRQLGKDSVVVNDSPGFVSNRVLMLTINEAICLVSENVALPSDVDKIFRECFGHKMGPLETADLIGLDTILNSLEVLFETFKDGKFRPCFLLQEMVDAGLLGNKSGKGFYEYNSLVSTR